MVEKKRAKTVTNNSKLTSTHFVSEIRHQNRCTLDHEFINTHFVVAQADFRDVGDLMMVTDIRWQILDDKTVTIIPSPTSQSWHQHTSYLWWQEYLHDHTLHHKNINPLRLTGLHNSKTSFRSLYSNMNIFRLLMLTLIRVMMLKVTERCRNTVRQALLTELKLNKMKFSFKNSLIQAWNQADVNSMTRVG